MFMIQIAGEIRKKQRAIGARKSTRSDVSAIVSTPPLRGKCGRGQTVAMTALIALIAAPSAGLFAAPANAQLVPAASAAPADPFADFVVEASRRFSVPADWIRAVMRVESRSGRRATSPKGAMGLMQIMPSTWTLLRSRFRAQTKIKLSDFSGL